MKIRYSLKTVADFFYCMYNKWMEGIFKINLLLAQTSPKSSNRKAHNS